MNPRLKQLCPLCVGWGQAEPNCAHGLEDGVNPGSLYFAPSRSLTLEVGVTVAKAITEENKVGRQNRADYVVRLAAHGAA